MTQRLPYIIGDSKHIRGMSKPPLSAPRMKAFLRQIPGSTGRVQVLLGSLLLLTLFGVYTSRPDRMMSDCVQDMRSKAPLTTFTQDGSLKVPSILDVAEQHLNAKAKDFDYVHYNTEYGLNFRYRSLIDYLEHTQTTLRDLFEFEGMQLLPDDEMRRKDLLTQLTLAGLERTGWDLDDAMPRNIFTTSQYLDGDQWDQFPLWTSLNPDWKLTHVDDAGISAWLNATFTRYDGEGRLRQAKIIEVFEKLHRGVLKGKDAHCQARIGWLMHFFTQPISFGTSSCIGKAVASTVAADSRLRSLTVSRCSLLRHGHGSLQPHVGLAWLIRAGRDRAGV